jgi:hypothetical protein
LNCETNTYNLNIIANSSKMQKLVDMIGFEIVPKNHFVDLSGILAASQILLF